MLREFKEFAMQGNVLDMAVGIVVGASFGKIVTSLVNDVLTPPIGLLLGEINFSSLFINLSSQQFTTLAEAQKAGAVTINYGSFLTTIVDFTVVSFALFLLVRQVNRFRRAKTGAAPAAKECRFCLGSVPAKAIRCSHCTSLLEPS